MNFLKCTVFALGIITIGACKKSEEQPNKLVGIWLKKKSERKSTGSPWEDITQDCMLDNTEEYRANGTYVLYPGSDWCTPSDETIEGTWKLTAGGTIIQYTYKGVSGTYESTISSVDNTTLVVTFATGTGAGDQIRDTYTRKQ